MKQILQNIKDGSTELADVPAPGPRAGHLLVRTRRSLISAGTERMLVEFGRSGWFQKARQQPDKVRQVLGKIRTDGLLPTIDAVRSKLGQPLPLGYCNVGEVIAVGEGVSAFSVGDRVASNGHHAEIVNVPANLCARVPDAVDDDSAAFAVIGAIGLQGIRLAAPTLGECFVVLGLGLIGLATVQLLRAHGCRVLGCDFDAAKLALAREFGAETFELTGGADPVAAALAFSRGRGVDGVLLTATTRSSDPVTWAARMSRKRGRLVLVGVTGLELSRADFYEKELSFQVSCSYGPGRYDPAYEQGGHDYPLGFVRWTEQRNFEAVLDMLADARVNVAPMISHRFALADAPRAYALIAGDEPSLGVLLEYAGSGEGDEAPALLDRTLGQRATMAQRGRVVVGAIGAGNYATGVLLPAFRGAGATLRVVASATGSASAIAARRFGFSLASTDIDSVLSDEAVTTVVIATRHDSHASLVCRALAAGKHVFVEKPLALTLEDVDRIDRARAAADREVMVGFNRRFAPHAVRLKQWLATVPGPKSFTMTVNAGSVPEGHWTRDPRAGGGRIVGEACHFIDLLRHLAGSRIRSADAIGAAGAGDDAPAVLMLGFEDGSIGAIHYFTNGNKALPKERLEVFAAGRVACLDNFRDLRAYGWPGARRLRGWRQDKGQLACVAAFVAAIGAGAPAPIAWSELVEVSRASIRLAEAARRNWLAADAAGARDDGASGQGCGT